MSSPRKVIITAAGMGTRLLPMSKELPKEMLPLFGRSDNVLTLKPLLQLLFEQFYDFGFRDICFVVGRGKRAIEDHFTEDRLFLDNLRRKGRDRFSENLGTFYKKVEDSNLVWINQPEPEGFGDAVLKSKGFVADDEFLVAAGDTIILGPHTKNNQHLERLMETHERHGSSATFAAMRVPDPEHYGVIQTSRKDPEMVVEVAEKPAKPKGNLAIMPLYVFKPEIFEALKSIGKGTGSELQLTDAIQELIRKGKKVCAVRLRPDEKRLDIGTPRTYWDAISESYRISTRS